MCGVVFIDVDGTLIDCGSGIHEPSKQTIKAIKTLQNKGYFVILSTGRPKSFLPQSILDLDLNGYITSNGAYVEFDGKELVNNHIDPERLTEIISFFTENNIEYVLEGQEISIFYNLDSNDSQRLINSFSLPVSKLKSRDDGEIGKVNKLVAYFNTQEKYNLVTEKYSGIFRFMRHPIGVTYDMYINNYTKGYAIKELINYLGINKEFTYAFGDGKNDVEMFQMVGKGVAMGGAHKELLKYSYCTTSSVGEDGIFIGLQTLNLI